MLEKENPFIPKVNKPNNKLVIPKNLIEMKKDENLN